MGMVVKLNRFVVKLGLLVCRLVRLVVRKCLKCRSRRLALVSCRRGVRRRLTFRVCALVSRGLSATWAVVLAGLNTCEVLAGAPDLGAGGSLASVET